MWKPEIINRKGVIPSPLRMAGHADDVNRESGIDSG
jgi:hypothetical protein